MSLATLTVNDQSVQSAFDRLAKFGSDQSGVTPRIAMRMLQSTEENFAKEGRPKWKPMAPSTKAQRGGGAKLLQKSGQLASSVTPFSSKDSAGVGTNKIYARPQQLGTGPFIIRPKKKKALFWLGAGHPVREVKHPGLHARPFFNLTDQDNLDIITIIDLHIKTISR